MREAIFTRGEKKSVWETACGKQLAEDATHQIFTHGTSKTSCLLRGANKAFGSVEEVDGARAVRDQETLQTQALQ